MFGESENDSSNSFTRVFFESIYDKLRVRPSKHYSLVCNVGEQLDPVGTWTTADNEHLNSTLRSFSSCPNGYRSGSNPAFDCRPLPTSSKYSFEDPTISEKNNSRDSIPKNSMGKPLVFGDNSWACGESTKLQELVDILGPNHPLIANEAFLFNFFSELNLSNKRITCLEEILPSKLDKSLLEAAQTVKDLDGLHTIVHKFLTNSRFNSHGKVNLTDALRSDLFSDSGHSRTHVNMNDNNSKNNSNQGNRLDTNVNSSSLNPMGILSTNLLRFTSLKFLNLSHNQIRVLPLNLPPNLLVLLLHGNLISSVTPATISDSGPQVSSSLLNKGKQPTSEDPFGRPPRVGKLLPSNPKLQSSSKLIHLGLSYNNLDDSSIAHISAAFPTLVSLDLSNNTGITDPRTILGWSKKRFPSLKNLTLAGSAVSLMPHYRLVVIRALPNLVTLDDLKIAQAEIEAAHTVSSDVLTQLDNVGWKVPIGIRIHSLKGLQPVILSPIKMKFERRRRALRAVFEGKKKVVLERHQMLIDGRAQSHVGSSEIEDGMIADGGDRLKKEKIMESEIVNLNQQLEISLNDLLREERKELHQICDLIYNESTEFYFEMNNPSGAHLPNIRSKVPFRLLDDLRESEKLNQASALNNAKSGSKIVETKGKKDKKTPEELALEAEAASKAILAPVTEDFRPIVFHPLPNVVPSETSNKKGGNNVVADVSTSPVTPAVPQENDSTGLLKCLQQLRTEISVHSADGTLQKLAAWIGFDWANIRIVMVCPSPLNPEEDAIMTAYKTAIELAGPKKTPSGSDYENGLNLLQSLKTRPKKESVVGVIAVSLSSTLDTKLSPTSEEVVSLASKFSGLKVSNQGYGSRCKLLDVKFHPEDNLGSELGFSDDENDSMNFIGASNAGNQPEGLQIKNYNRTGIVNELESGYSSDDPDSTSKLTFSRASINEMSLIRNHLEDHKISKIFSIMNSTPLRLTSGISLRLNTPPATQSTGFQSCLLLSGSAVSVDGSFVEDSNEAIALQSTLARIPPELANALEIGSGRGGSRGLLRGSSSFKRRDRNQDICSVNVEGLLWMPEFN